MRNTHAGNGIRFVWNIRENHRSKVNFLIFRIHKELRFLEFQYIPQKVRFLYRHGCYRSREESWFSRMHSNVFFRILHGSYRGSFFYT